MKNKFLVFEQTFESPLSCKHIVDKKNFEAYTHAYVQYFIDSQLKKDLVYKYISHEIDQEDNGNYIVNITFAINTGNYYKGFELISLENVKTWEAPAKLKVKVKVKESKPYKTEEACLPYYRQTITNAPPKPELITLDDLTFYKDQIVSKPIIIKTAEHDFMNEQGYKEKIATRLQYESITLNLIANMNQIKTFRKSFDHNPQTKIQNLSIFWKDQPSIKIEGFIRDMKFQAFDEMDQPNQMEVELSFIVRTYKEN